MVVTTYCINQGTPSQYYGLKNAEENTVLHFAPNNWKTEAGGEKVGAAERIHSQRGKAEGQTGKSNGKFCCSA